MDTTSGAPGAANDLGAELEAGALVTEGAGTAVTADVEGGVVAGVPRVEPPPAQAVAVTAANATAAISPMFFTRQS